jgi:hypothetical protein
VTGTGDTVILHQELAYADVLPVAFRPLDGPLDGVYAASLADRNLRTLLACAALEEHGQHDKPVEDSPHAADILRIDLKVNLLLDMVGALLAASQSRPPAVPARFNPHGIVWESAGPQGVPRPAAGARRHRRRGSGRTPRARALRADPGPGGRPVRTPGVPAASPAGRRGQDAATRLGASPKTRKNP